MSTFNASMTHRLYSLLQVGLLVLTFALPLVFFGQAQAVSKTWDGGCGVDTTWSCANNWSDDIVPASGDTVTFNSTFSGNSTVDASFAGAITTININSGYTGTVSLSRSLSVSASFVQTTGTFTAGSQSLDVAVFALSGGSFTASSGITSASAGFTIGGTATFNANGGTVNFNGSSSAALTCGNATFNLVTFTHTGGNKTVGSDCSLPLGNNPTLGTAPGAVAVNGTLSGTGTLSAVGTMTLGSGSSLSGFSGYTNVGNLTVSGNYNFGSYTTFSVGGTFTLSTGVTMTAPSGTASFSASFTLASGSTFNANGGTVNFTRSVGGTSTLSCNNTAFNLVTLTHTTGTVSVGSDCSLPLGNNPSSNSGGGITLGGTLSGSGTFTTTGNLTLSCGGAFSGFSGFVSSNAVAVNGSYNFGSYTTFSSSSTFTLNSSGVFTAPTGTASFGGTVTLNSGSTFTANGGTVNLNGGTGTLTCNSTSFNIVTFTHASGTKTVGSDCSLPLGTNPTVGTGGAVTLNGTLTGSGTINKPGTNGFTLGTTGSLSGFTGLSTTGSLTVNGTYNFSSYSPFSVADNFVLNSGGVFTAPSGTASFSRNFTLNSGSTFNDNGGTINFNGTLPIGINCNNAAIFHLVTFTHTAGTKTVNAGCNMPVGNNPVIGLGGSIGVTGTLTGTGLFTASGTTLNAGGVLSGFSGMSVGFLIVNGTADFSNYSPFSATGNFLLNSSGVFTAPAGTASFGGNVTLTTGSTFNANGGTVVLTGTNQTIAGNNPTFYNLTKTVSSADTLTFSASNAITVTGTLTLKGVNGGLLSLVSTIPGTWWYINLQGTANVNYLSVTDSQSIGKGIVVCNSVDGGNNIGWSFNPAACSDAGASGGINNYTAAQAAYIGKKQQDEAAAAAAAATANRDSSLPSQVSDFVKSFPQGKALVKGAKQFLIALVIILALVGVGLFFFVIGRKRRKDEEEGPHLPPQTDMPPGADDDKLPPILRLNLPPPGTPKTSTVVGQSGIYLPHFSRTAAPQPTIHQQPLPTTPPQPKTPTPAKPAPQTQPAPSIHRKAMEPGSIVEPVISSGGVHHEGI